MEVLGPGQNWGRLSAVMPPLVPLPARPGVDGWGFVVRGGGAAAMTEQVGRAERVEGVQAAQIAINGMWAKGAAALGIPFIITLVGIVLATAATVSRLEASTDQMRTEVGRLQVPADQVRAEERRWATILGGINDRLGRIENQLRIQSPPTQQP